MLLLRVLALGVVLGIASTAAAQTPAVQQSRLEILTRQGDFYWVVETAPDGSRKGGWVNVQVPLDRIDRNALKPIPALPPLPTAPQQPSDAALNERLSRIEQALATGQSAGPNVATQSEIPVRSTPLSQVAQPQPVSVPRRSHSREGFFFNVGLGWGSAGCEGCFGRDGGPTGGLSLGGHINDRVSLGIGTANWMKSVDGVTLSGGIIDARMRVYPSVNSGFFLTAGLGVGAINMRVPGLLNDSYTGAGALFGLGWDIRVGRNVSLTPFYNGFAVATEVLNGNVAQIGLGVTIH